MKILVACEESQTVCKAFRTLGHEAFSCDILPCSGGHPEWHIQDDVLKHLNDGWDMMIAHPPCTYLSNAGIRWFNVERYGNKAVARRHRRDAAVEFVRSLWNAPIAKIAIENPVGYLNRHWMAPSQTIQPWQFGHSETKRTCLWLKELPALRPTDVVSVKPAAYYKRGEQKGKPIPRWMYCKFGEDRSILRSKFFEGIAKAMAEQWGGVK